MAESESAPRYRLTLKVCNFNRAGCSAPRMGRGQWYCVWHTKLYRLRRNHGWSMETLTHLDRALTAQGFACAICREPFVTEADAQLDHDHRTNEPRGWLCGWCNRGIENFREDPTLFAWALAYLEIYDHEKSPQGPESKGASL